MHAMCRWPNLGRAATCRPAHRGREVDPEHAPGQGAPAPVAAHPMTADRGPGVGGGARLAAWLARFARRLLTSLSPLGAQRRSTWSPDQASTGVEHVGACATTSA